MKKLVNKLKLLTRGQVLMVAVLSLSFLVVASVAFATLTFTATTTTTDGDYTLNGVAASIYSIGAATTSGTITIGGTAQTGNMVFGSSSGTSTVKIGAGAGASTVTIAEGTAGANTVSILNGATAATGTVNILSGTGTAGGGALAMGNNPRVTAVTLANGANAAAMTVDIASGAAGANRTVTIAGGTAAAGTDTLNLGTGGAKVITVGNATGASSLVLNAGTGDIVVTSVDDLTLNGGSAGSIVNLGTNTHGNVINIGTDNTTLDAINVGSALDTVIIRGTSGSAGVAGLSQVELAARRTTGLTGSYQTLAGDLTYEGAAGGTSSYHAGVMGNFLGDTLTNTNATVHAGTIGKYSVTTSDALVGPKAGLVGEAETSVANSAVMAVLGGDTGTVAPGAAYAVRYLNSTAASKFTYGLDLFSAAVGSYKAVDYGTADIRLVNQETIKNSTDSTITLSRNDAGTLTVTAADNDAIAALTILPGGAAAFILGGASTTSIALTSDGGTVTLDGNVSGAITRATGATGSYQVISGDLTYEGAAGLTSTFHAGVMGNFLGASLTNSNASYHAGVIGSYNVTTADANIGVQAGVVGEVGDLAVASGTNAFTAVLGGDSGALTPDAAYGVASFNSTAASKFSYGLDLSRAAIGTYLAVSYGTADIRLVNGETISNGTDGTIALNGFLVKSINAALTALAGGAQAGTALNRDINIVSTVATAGDSVQLPVAVPGMEIVIVNRAGNSLNVFGRTGDGINAGGANAAYAVATLVEARCIAVLASGATAWECQKLAR